MALDGILLSKIIPEIAKALPLRIQKIWDISSTELLFQVHGSPGKKLMLISCHSVYNRFLFTDKNYPTPDEPGNFVMVLRKYIEGGFIEEIEQAALDRWCVMNIRKRNSIGDLEYYRLYVELMGKYANVILVSHEGKILDAFKRIPPFENSRRTIFPGAVFVPTPPQNKKNPFENPLIDTEQSLTKQFAGFSPFLSSEIEYRMAHGERFTDILKEIQESDRLYAFEGEGEPVFHCIELKSRGRCRSWPLFEGFDALYYHREEKERIRTISGDIFRFVKRELKHQQTKLPRLLSEMDEALDCEKYRVYGELLYAYNITDTKGTDTITLKSFEDDSDVVIPLDPKLDGKANARKAFTRYNKLKKGQVYL
ncbi:MAG: NFACT family protein, partial [Solobacterium sp.]|nr:NFACT family protein [Solobacterium sp.]